MRLKCLRGTVGVALDRLIAPGLTSAVVGLVWVAGVPLGSGAADGFIPVVPSLDLPLKNGLQFCSHNLRLEGFVAPSADTGWCW